MKYSYSRVSMYKRCPQQFKRKYIDGLPEVKSEALINGSAMHEAIEAYNLHLLKEGLKTDMDFLRNCPATPEVAELLDHFAETHMLEAGKYFIEEFWDFPLDGSKWTAKIDLCKDEGDQVIIRDYKSDHALRSQADVEKDFQLKTYAKAASCRFPDADEITCIIDFVRFGVTRQVTYTPEDMSKIEREMIALVNQIEGDTDYDATPGAGCAWCSYSEGCPALKAGVDAITTPHDAKRLAGEKIALEARKSAIDKLLKEYCTQEGSVEVNGMDVGWQRSETTKYPDAVAVSVELEKAGFNGSDVLRIDATAMKRLLKQDGIKETLEQKGLLETTSSTTFKAVKAKGGDDE